MTTTFTKEQKTGISVLLLSKLFERISFYLVMSILVRYLTDSLNIEATTAGVYYSIFYGAIFIMSLVSGLIGDIGYRVKIVTTGFVIMPAMYLLLAFLPNAIAATMTTLIILALGIGLVSPNIIVLLGNIYNEKNNEIIGLSGFILFSIITSTGGFIAPLLSVFIRNNLGYSTVFVFASVFVLISLVLFNRFKLISAQLAPDKVENIESRPIKNLNTVILFSILIIGILIRFALNQNDLTFTYSVKDYMDNGYHLSQTFKDFDSYISIILLTVFAITIARTKQLTWAKVFNIILVGVILCSFVFISLACYHSLSQTLEPSTIFIKSFVILLIAETLISPTIFYTIYRSSPIKRKGLFQGISYLIMGISNQLLFLGAMLYQKNQALAYLVFGTCLLTCAIFILILKIIVRKRLLEISNLTNN